TQSGGTINATLQNPGVFTYQSGLFNARLYNQGVANINADFTAANGIENNGTITPASGKTLTLNGAGLDNEGLITLAANTLTSPAAVINNGQILGNGAINGAGGFRNNLLLSQSAGNLAIGNTGANSNQGNIDLASGWQLRLTGGSLAN